MEEAPNVSVLAGATVKLVAKLTGKAKAARIVLREGGKIEMEKVGETDFAASMTVNKDNTYHIEVTSVEGDVLVTGRTNTTSPCSKTARPRSPLKSPVATRAPRASRRSSRRPRPRTITASSRSTSISRSTAARRRRSTCRS